MSTPTTQRACLLRERLAHRIGANRFRTWFADSTDLVLHDDRLDVIVANSFVKSWIHTNYYDDLVSVASEVLETDEPPDVQIIENGAGRQPHPGPVTPPEQAQPGYANGKRRNSATLRGRLQTFVVGPSNRVAYAAASSMAHNPGRDCNLLVLHGACGLGKTHLLQAICNGVAEGHPTLRWRYVSGEEFTNQFIHAVKSGRIDAFRMRMREVDVLVIDDVHFLANKKATQEEFLHTFDAIDAAGRCVVLSSDRHPREIATLSEPLLDRLIAGMVVRIETPERETRLEILRRRARQMEHRIDDAVLEYIAQHITRNVRELEGALYKLVALASLTRDKVTLDLARAALEDHIQQARRQPDISDVGRRVTARFGVTRDQINSRSRDRTVALARAVQMYLVRHHTTLSFPEIGRRMGNKNHSTVLMAVQRVENLLRDNGLVTWKIDGRSHEAPVRGIIDELERDLRRPGD